MHHKILAISNLEVDNVKLPSHSKTSPLANSASALSQSDGLHLNSWCVWLSLNIRQSTIQQILTGRLKQSTFYKYSVHYSIKTSHVNYTALWFEPCTLQHKKYKSVAFFLLYNVYN